MSLLRFLLFFFVILLSNKKCFSVNFMEFVTVPQTSQETFILLTDKNPTVSIDASSKRQRIIYFAQRSRYLAQKLTLHCKINEQPTPLKAVSICCRRSVKVQDAKCNPIDIDKSSGQISCLDAQFSYEVDQKSGAVFSILFDKYSHLPSPINGLYYCSVTDGHSNTIESNEIEIRDAVYYFQTISILPLNDITSIGPLNINHFPHKFTCFDDHINSNSWPEWMYELDSKFGPYEWVYCDFGGPLNAITCVRQSAHVPADSSIVYSNGTLFLTDPNFIRNKNRVISCKLAGQDAVVKTYAGSASQATTPVILSPITIDENPDPSVQLKALSDTQMHYVIVKGTVLDNFALKSLYSLPDGEVTYEWRKNDREIPRKLTSKFTCKLTTVADESTEGIYTLLVTSKSGEILRFTHTVEIVSAPVFKYPDCFEGLHYVMQGQNFIKKCEFTAKSGALPYVGVNHIEAGSVDALRSRIYDSYRYTRAALSELQIGYNIQSDDADVQSFHLSVLNLIPEQDCQLSLRLDSTYGQAHLSSSLKVVPKPSLIVSPSSQNCIQDCDKKPFNISCTLNPELVENWRSNFRIRPEISWLIQNKWNTEDMKPDGLGRFITLNADNSVITVWPSGRSESEAMLLEQQQEQSKASNQEEKTEPNVEQQQQQQEEEAESDLVDENLGVQAATLKQYIAQRLGGPEIVSPKDLVLRCLIRLYVEEQQARFNPVRNLLTRTRSKRQSVLLASDRVIYDSEFEQDQSHLNQFMVTRTFTPDAFPATASLAWVAAVVLGLIVVIVVIGLSVWLCTRDRGETYMVYDQEKAHGNDPVQELKEKTTFQTFHREDEPPVASSHYSPNDGADIASDDDGELDNYQEEASFIGEYSFPPNLAVPEVSHKMPPATTNDRTVRQNHTVV